MLRGARGRLCDYRKGSNELRSIPLASSSDLKSHQQGNIAESGLNIEKDTRGPNKPATSVNWFEAARFVNWLNISSGSSPAYKFDGNNNFQLWMPGDPGYNPSNLYRNSLAKYFLPSVDEWYKAAYYDPVGSNYYDYPTGSNIAPDGIDFAGDSAFEAVFSDGGVNAEPNDVTDVGI